MICIIKMKSGIIDNKKFICDIYMSNKTSKHITLIILDNFLASGLSGAIDLLHTANLVYKYMHRNDPALFEWSVVSINTDTVKASNGYPHPIDHTLDEVQNTDVVYIPGVSSIREQTILDVLQQNHILYRWLKEQAINNTIITSSCTGSLFLAQAGILNNKKVTTSWMLADLFRRQFPHVNLSDDELLVDEGSIITSGAACSYQELMLTIIKRFAGKELASLTAKYMLIEGNRASQAAFKVNVPSTYDLEDTLITDAIELIRKNINKNFSINELAENLHVSYRTLIRRFQASLGINIKSYIQNQRVESAKRLLELSQLNFDEIVYKIGYADASAFRKLFKKSTGMTPKSYKQKFCAHQ